MEGEGDCVEEVVVLGETLLKPVALAVGDIVIVAVGDRVPEVVADREAVALAESDTLGVEDASALGEPPPPTDQACAEGEGDCVEDAVGLGEVLLLATDHANAEGEGDWVEDAVALDEPPPPRDQACTEGEGDCVEEVVMLGEPLLKLVALVVGGDEAVAVSEPVIEVVAVGKAVALACSCESAASSNVVSARA